MRTRSENSFFIASIMTVAYPSAASSSRPSTGSHFGDLHMSDFVQQNEQQVADDEADGVAALRVREAAEHRLTLQRLRCGVDFALQDGRITVERRRRPHAKQEGNNKRSQ